MLGDNGRQPRAMTDDNERTPAISFAQAPRRLRRRLRALASGLLWRLAPGYARRRAARADATARLGRVEAELQRVGERHGEQIERLEDLARELILTAESQRRDVGDVDHAMKSAARSSRREIELIEAELNAVPYVADSPFETVQSPVREGFGYRSASSLRGRGPRS